VSGVAPFPPSGLVWSTGIDECGHWWWVPGWFGWGHQSVAVVAVDVAGGGQRKQGEVKSVGGRTPVNYWAG